ETAWSLPDTSAVALWLAPGVEADGDEITDVLVGSVAVDKHDGTHDRGAHSVVTSRDVSSTPGVLAGASTAWLPCDSQPSVDQRSGQVEPVGVAA
ncbi:MAG: hypothetical protein QOE63_595, partial [Acidimicrobiaceae bacterium]